MPQATCAYCKQPAVFTKEHLWPAALHKRLYAANKQTSHAFWLARLRREIPAEPQIRDVCAHCNNVTLSELDSYICRLFDESFVKIHQRDEDVHFKYDYHLLKRWLLKMSFNSARIHDSVDRQALDTLLPYILGTDNRLGRSVQLFVQLTYPELVPQDELASSSESSEGLVLEPTIHRVGHLFFRAHGVGQKLLRTVHLRSYSFFLAYWPPAGRLSEQDDFESIFTSGNESAELLRPSRPYVHLKCNGIGAWASVRDSRNGQFICDDGA